MTDHSEIRGPSPWDGTHISLPADVCAIVLIRDEGDGLRAEYMTEGSATVDPHSAAHALAGLAVQLMPEE